ncbi:MAG TPA: helix-turn-helix domain-containing protein [Candidatus Omnitrophota bacterium]|nr:helix-turn-helix domain-containing protein [Candidatus Omnitrophota bacterium]HPD85274.1 helix-turn-helix domain-containing protein [Candidatus Omnitrophota bacterium]HRZ04225.1 helix-turn-helix domain-containing protein [Candidatus Omnitrophota bacterium]
MSDQFISVREAAQTLGVTEKKIMDLIDEGKLHAYKIAGQFLRLKKSEVLDTQDGGTVATEFNHYPYTRAERIKDFFYFNDFYILSLVIILALLYVIFYR